MATLDMTVTPTAPLPPLGTIKVRIDRVYGKITVYPACRRSALLAQIAGTKTLTPDTLALATRLGFTAVESEAGMRAAFLAEEARS